MLTDTQHEGELMLKNTPAVPAVFFPGPAMRSPRSTTTSPAFPLMVTALPLVARMATSAPGALESVIDFAIVVGS
jgi:hypothetical protein